MDNVYDRISVILDGSLVFDNIPRSEMAYFSPALSFSVGPGNANHIEIDDVVVWAFYSQDNGIQWFPLFREDFEQLNEKNGIESSGWRTKSERVLESTQEEGRKGAYVALDQASEMKALTIKSGKEEKVMVVKTFNIPVDFPFDVSDKTFEIRYNDDMYTDEAAYDDYPGHGGSGVSSNNFYSSSSNTFSNSTPGRSRTSQLYNTYYIYTFDGKLLAEYDHNGNCVRDYIYFGNRLLAEYRPQTNEYFYYMTDQINSTRIITDVNSNVRFSEAYGPYGDIQKTWTNTYDPKLKFSGKEREGYSDLDYFGARYYDHKSYRFNSVDPIINKTEALYNPQLWNLYAYCRNNPITYFDPDGRESILDKLKEIPGKIVPKGMMPDTMQMEGWEENKQTYDKYIGDAIKITAGAAILAVGIDIVSGENKGGGGKKATDSSKGMPHGDSGRALTKAEKQIQGFEEQLKTAKGKEKTRIKQKIKNIREAAQKAKKGKTHHRK
jgi:RHS repeat-associated protein